MRTPRSACLSAGFTLIELLVILTIIGVLVALTLPAVQAARESSRRSWCANNLRQIGVALHQYELAIGSLPPGRTVLYDPRYSGSNPPCTSPNVDKSIFVSILPWLEQNALYNAINQNVTIFGFENLTVASVAVGAYLCPTDTEAGRPLPGDWDRTDVHQPFWINGTPVVRASYSGSFGSVAVMALPTPYNNCAVPAVLKVQANGVFTDDSPIRAASVVDGLSHTMFVAEKSYTALKGLDSIDQNARASFDWWISSDLDSMVFSAMYPPNMFKKVSYYAIESHRYAAGSLHPGGLHALFGDGSTRFIRDTIDCWRFSSVSGDPSGSKRSIGGWMENLPRPGVWQALATRAGGEAIPSDAL